MASYFKDPRGQVVEFTDIPRDSDMAHMTKQGWKKTTKAAYASQSKDRSLLLTQFLPESPMALGAPRVCGVFVDKAGNSSSISSVISSSPSLGLVAGVL